MISRRIEPKYRLSTTMSHRATAFALVLAACAGCESRSRDAEPSPSAVTPPATSQLRGTLSRDGEQWKFRPCEGEEMPAVDSSGGMLPRVVAGESAAAGAYVEVRGHLAADSSLVVTEVEAAFPGEGGGCGRAAPAVEALARGNEPFWAITVDRTRERISWQTPSDSFETPYGPRGWKPTAGLTPFEPRRIR